MIALLAVSVLSLVGSFVCSLSEAALYSISESKVGAMVEQKKHGAALLAKVRSQMDRAIAAILIINTCANTVGAAVAGAIVANLYGQTWLGVFTGLFTLAVLFASEIVPKSLGVARADFFAPRFAWVIHVMILLTFPLVRVAELVTRRINGDRPHQAPTELEIMTLTRLAARHGALPPHEAQMVFNALRLNDVRLREIMTPRPVVFALPDTLPLKRVEQHSEHWTHSRLPVVRDTNPSEVRGIVHRRDVFDILIREQEGDRTLADVMRPVRFVRDTQTADEALRMFLDGREHMFVVHDEYGLYVGIVTLEDVLETLLGREIVGEHDPVADMQALARRRAAERGLRVPAPPSAQSPPQQPRPDIRQA